MTVLSIDIETYSDEDLPKTGVYRYAESPVFAVTLFAYAYGDQDVQIVDLLQGEKIPDQVLRDLVDHYVVKTAFNAAFERTCLGQHLGQYLPPEQWRCTSVLALTLGLPGNLGAVGDALRLRKDRKKMGVGRSLINYFCKPCKPTKVNGQRTRNFPHHDPDRWNLFREYCKQDVVSEREIRNRLLAFDVLPEEQALWCLDQRINERGAPLDMQLVEHAIRCDEIYAERLLTEAISITGLKNPKSVAQLKKWLRDVDDIDVESLNKQVVPELLRGTSNDSVRRVLELRQEMAKSSVSKYKAMKRAVSSDGRVRGLHQFYGANRTGRWAGRIVQTQNLPQNKLEDLDLARVLLRAGKYDELEMLFGNIPDTLSQLIRTAIIPSSGRQLMVVDFSAIEARVLAWLAWEVWRLDVFNTHGMIYEASAAEMFHVRINSIQYIDEKGEKQKGDNYPLRQKGKVAELALGYQGGAGALITMGALKMGLTEDELDPIKVAWRGANRRIERFWYDVERAAIQAITGKGFVHLPIAGGLTELVFSYEKGCLFIELPSGRRLCYYRARMEHDTKFDKMAITYGGLDQKTKQWSDNIRTYGGKLVENITQAIARDCLRESLFGLDEAKFETIMHVHDEAVTDGGDLELGEAIMGAPIPWAPQLPLRGDGYLTPYYKKDS